MNANAEYAKYLKTDQWHEVSAARKYMDGNTCVCCGSNEQLAAHHVVYPGKWSDTTTDHLVTLCKDCHTAIHRIQEIIDDRESHLEAYIDTERKTNPKIQEPHVTYEYRHKYAREIARFTTVECWRHNFFSTTDISRYCSKIREVIERSGRHVLGFADTTMRILATAKDCYIANAKPQFDKTKRRARAKRRTKYK